MPKTAKAELAPMPLEVNLSLESLTQLFSEYMAGIERQEEIEDAEEKSKALATSVRNAADVLTLGEKDAIVARRDNLVELIFAIEERELRIRKTVKSAELIARHYAAFNKNLKDSLLLAMIEKGIDRAEGNVHRLALYKQPDQLVILNEREIPEEFFDQVPNIQDIVSGIFRLTSIDDEKLELIHDFLTSQLHPERVLNKDRVKEALAAGMAVPGAMLEVNRRRIDIK
jgi:hypothetical protein